MLFCCPDPRSFTEAPTPAVLANAFHCRHLLPRDAALCPPRCSERRRARAPRAGEESRLSNPARSSTPNARLQAGRLPLASLTSTVTPPSTEGPLDRSAKWRNCELGASPFWPPGQYLLRRCPAGTRGLPAVPVWPGGRCLFRGRAQKDS